MCQTWRLPRSRPDAAMLRVRDHDQRGRMGNGGVQAHPQSFRVKRREALVQDGQGSVLQQRQSGERETETYIRIAAQRNRAGSPCS